MSFLWLAVQLILLFAVIRVFRMETRNFQILVAIAFSGFAVHYWLPFRWKEPFWILLSVGGAFFLLLAETAILLILAGMVFFAIVRSSLPFSVRAGLVALLGAAAIYGRHAGAPAVPAELWPVFGSIFMFRMIVYLYDARHERGRRSLKEYLRYFYICQGGYLLDSGSHNL